MKKSYAKITPYGFLIIKPSFLGVIIERLVRILLSGVFNPQKRKRRNLWFDRGNDLLIQETIKNM